MIGMLYIMLFTEHKILYFFFKKIFKHGNSLSPPITPYHHMVYTLYTPVSTDFFSDFNFIPITLYEK